ncbi:Uma2 family endonuclease [Thermus sp.]|uniref:Uma2 family endonuclease n=1 Tax=Thermus sp. TaxID=275 RepID=UPI00307D19A2
MALALQLSHPVTEEELRRLSELNPGYQLERTAEGRLWVSPTGGQSGRRSLLLAYQLARWNEETGLGVVFDASTGFRMPDGSILSPDAAWLALKRWEGLSEAEKEGFPPLAPDAAFEVRSPSQSPEELRTKMGLYLRNGVRLGVLVDPYARTVEVFRPGQEPLRLEDPEAVPLDPELPGFLLRPRALW